MPASAAVHLLYRFGLLAGYRLGEFSQVYPLARGTSPWAVTPVSLLLLGQHLPVVELIGVLVVSAGLGPAGAGFPARTSEASADRNCRWMRFLGRSRDRFVGRTRGILRPVAALRETSIVFGALIGGVVLGELAGRSRALLAEVVVAGIVLINLA